MAFIIDVLKHKALVFSYMFRVSMQILWRAIVHDNSKFSGVELSTFQRVFPKLRSTTYGTPEYFELLKELGSALDHHYKVNSHHPEHYVWAGVKGDYEQLTIIDRLEMLCDWAAATKKHDDGDLHDSITKNGGRFKYDFEEKQRLIKSAQEMKLF